MDFAEIYIMRASVLIKPANSSKVATTYKIPSLFKLVFCDSHFRIPFKMTYEERWLGLASQVTSPAEGKELIQ